MNGDYETVCLMIDGWEVEVFFNFLDKEREKITVMNGVRTKTGESVSVGTEHHEAIKEAFEEHMLLMAERKYDYGY